VSMSFTLTAGFAVFFAIRPSRSSVDDRSSLQVPPSSAPAQRFRRASRFDPIFAG